LLTHGSHVTALLDYDDRTTLNVEQVTNGHRPLGNGATGVSRACPCVAEAPSEAEGEVEGSSIAVAGRGARRSTRKIQRFSTATYFCG